MKKRTYSRISKPTYRYTKKFKYPTIKQILKSSGELKCMDTTLSQTDIVASTSDTSSSNVLNIVEVGNASWNRIGKTIHMQSMRIKGMLSYSYAPQATTGSILGTVVRMVVVYDKQPSGSQPAFSTIFGQQTLDGTESTLIFSNLKPDNTGRFKVIRDKYYEFQPRLWNNEAGTVDSGEAVKWVDEYVDLKGIKAIYSGQSDPGVMADISSGGLYVYFRSQAYTDTTAEVQFKNASCRLRFKD